MLAVQARRARSLSLPSRGVLVQTALPLCSQSDVENGPKWTRQTRAFRFGLWSSYLDPDYQREVQKRYRQMQKKQVENFNRSLLWNRQSYSSNKKSGRQRSNSQPQENVENSSYYLYKSKNPGNLSNLGGAIHVEQNPLGEIFKSQNDMIKKMIKVQAKIFGTPRSEPNVPSSTVSNVSSLSTPSSISYTAIKQKVSEKLNISPKAETSYTIDPITNKRVYHEEKDTSGLLDVNTTSDTMSSLESWLSPSHTLNPFAADPMRECLKSYEKDEHEAYTPVYYREPDGKILEEPCSTLNGLETYDNKVKYGPVYHNEPDGQPTVQPGSNEIGLREYDETHAYGPVLYREPDGKLPDSAYHLKTGLEEFDDKAKYGTSRKIAEGSQTRHYQVAEDKAEDLDLLRASDVLAASGVLRGPRKETSAEKASKRQQLEEDFHRTQTKLIEDLRIEHSELLNRVAHARGRVSAKIEQVEGDLINSASSRKLTGNYVRDFPEDFATSWKNISTDSGVLVPDVTLESKKTDVIPPMASASPLSYEESFKQTIQPALDRNQKVPELIDAGSRQNIRSQKLADKQRHKELVREIRQIYEDTYGVLDSKHRAPIVQAVSDTSASSITDHSVLYKILAYDPTMQSISEAETTSIVTDSATPLTPAEVLLRLSNPAKFFPHFAPLQAKGFEILTGGGDVLVFRKVRDASAKGVEGTTSASATKSYSSTRQNPIDGMQPMAATGNFASPTGFVNYDLPHDKDGEPQFKSNIDVRREEPVFSGKRNWQETTRKKRSGKGKKILIGAAWVGACSYAVGVVAEFFKTGGAEGFPKGF